MKECSVPFINGYIEKLAQLGGLDLGVRVYFFYRLPFGVGRNQDNNAHS